MLRKITLISALALAPLGAVAQSGPLTLEFRPPALEPRDVCNLDAADRGVDDLTVEGRDIELTDPDRIRFLRGDIRSYTNEDADGFFEFIDALILRRAEIDPTFTPVDVIFARIDLMLRAGRVSQLEDEGLLDDLRAQVDEMTNIQRTQLAQLFSQGLGVAPDLAFAQELILRAAYGGNAGALLEIARLAQSGTLIEGWDAPLDLTVTMAFGGLLGALDSGVCRRAERIAQEYLKGDLVEENQALAMAWYRFAADMGGADAAWRMVEFHLNAERDIKDNEELRHYLEQAVRLGVTLDNAARNALMTSGALTQTALETILGTNHSQDRRRTPNSLSDHLQLVVNIDGLEADEDGLLLDYLREIMQMPTAPGRIFDRLAAETLVRQGRWAGEQEAIDLLEEAVARGDANGHLRLARMLVRYRDDPAAVARVENLLSETVSRFGRAEAMDRLDTLYRCQVNDAPRLTQADHWADAYRASGHAALPISPPDLLALSIDRSPEAIAKIQSLALDRRTQMLASQAQRVHSAPLAARGAIRYWAAALNRSDRALEAFAEMEFELATTPHERDLAIEFFRRVYLNNGVTTALDLAIALTEYDARNPEVADEIEVLLTMAGNRGEGAAIRLLSRLQAQVRSEAEVFAQFADKIEARGDFLALMFAIPHLAPERVDDYVDRAVSLMSCGTKDADELGDAYAIHQNAELSYHWRQIGLHFEGGHVLSKLRLSNRQVAWYDDGKAPDPVARAARALAEGDPNALMQLVHLTADPDLPSYDPTAAVTHLNAAMSGEDGAAAHAVEVAAILRSTSDEVRRAFAKSTDMAAVLETAATAGDPEAAYALGVMIRDQATQGAELTQSLDWFEVAAKRGHRDAMFEAGHALGLGLGRGRDMAGAIAWLQQADDLGHPDAAALARRLRLAQGN